MCYTYNEYDEEAVSGGIATSRNSPEVHYVEKISIYIKLLALSMAAVLTLCACSGDNASSSDDSSVPDYVVDTSAKVGYVYNEEVSHDNMTYMFEKAVRI